MRTHWVLVSEDANSLSLASGKKEEHKTKGSRTPSSGVSSQELSSK
jgi:hypothetical protein